MRGESIMKKAVSLILALLIILSNFCFSASAAGSSFDSATSISFGQSYSGVMVKDGADYYKINLSSSGKITVSFNSNFYSIYFYLYSASGSKIDSFYDVRDSNSDTLKWQTSYDLVSGDYYIVFSERSDSTGNYSFDISYSSAQETFAEKQENKNNSFERSDEIVFNNTYRGQIAKNDGSDYYKINLSSSGKITVSFNSNLYSIYFYLYSASGSKIDSFYDVRDSNSDTLKWQTSYDLVSGDYYIVFSERSSSTGNYSFDVSYSSAQETFAENQENKNNSFESSDEIGFNNTYRGQIAKNDGSDYYKINLSSSGKIAVSFNSNLYSIYFYLYSASGSKIDSFYVVRDSNSDTLNWETSYDLVSGDYYIVFSERSNSTGNYSFSVSKGSSTPTQAPTTRPTERPTTTRPAEAPTTRNNTEKPTQAPTKAPEYIEPETYVEPEIDPDIDVDIDIYVYINFEYTIVNNYIIILNYFGEDSYVVVPEEIDGYEVKGIGDDAFTGTLAEEVEIPDCVTQFGSNAFGEESGQDIQLYCSEGSAAQNYADEKGIAYQLHMEDYADEGFSYDVDNGDDYVEDDADYDDNSGTSYGSGGITVRTIVIIAVVAVVAIGAIIAVIVIGKKKSMI